MTLANAGALVSLFAQQNKAPAPDAGGAMAGLACMLPCFIVFGLLFVVGIAIGWKLFAKAGQPGWASIVPIYSNWILVTEIAKKEPLWFFLMFVPIGNIIAAWVVCMEVAKKFGKSETFGIGLFFLGPICWAMLAFGDAKYQGKSKKADYDDEDEDEEEEDERPRGRR